VALIRGRRVGKDIPDLIEEVLIKPAQEQIQQQQAAAQAQQEAMAAAGPAGPGGPDGPGGEALDGVGANGLPTNVAPGQAGMAPGGRPSVSDLTAGFTSSGAPNMGATVRRRVATG
jgi:hypothetical protein